MTRTHYSLFLLPAGLFGDTEAETLNLFQGVTNDKEKSKGGGVNIGEEAVLGERWRWREARSLWDLRLKTSKILAGSRVRAIRPRD
jgi:hypothetical protein